MGEPPLQDLDGYRLERHLGSGAVGSVFLARDTLLERDVAIKLLQDPAASGPEVERFLTEARALARLQHPNVVAVHRVGSAVGRPYIVYELVRGTSLDQLPRPVPEPLVLRIAQDLARGLEAAHARGVIHRDVKPANAILSDDGPAKLVDFGLARIGEQPPQAALQNPTPRAVGASPALTAPGALLGTPSYMAPEAWSGAPVDARSDLYSLGALLYELLSGGPPHAAATEEALAYAVSTRDAQPLSWRAPGVSPELAAVIDRCLARDPAARFPSAAALVSALSLLAPRAGSSGVIEQPYRALEPFRLEDQRIFFGRERDVTRILERMRHAPLLVIAGDSGVGKSSLLHAGLAPRVLEDALGEERRWAYAALQPGRSPLLALLAALGPWIDQALAPIEPEELVMSPDVLARRLRQRLGARSGLVLLCDQLEELVTVAPEGEAQAAARALARLADRVPGVRLVASARSDLLSRLATLPELGEAMAPAIHLLRPLEPADLRELIVQPARLCGARFESEALVDELVAAVGAQSSRLPLLEFALAELWALRDRAAGLLTRAALQRIGGVAGALARHADGVLAGLRAEERALARSILLYAVSAGGTRRPFTRAELGAPGAHGPALEALVQGRLLVAHAAEGGGAETRYELVHEALIHSWSTLADWLRTDGGKRAAHERVTRAAEEWHRAGRPDDGLLLARSLKELDDAGLVEAELAVEARALVGASRAKVRRRRWARIGAAVLLLSLVATVYGATELVQVQRRARALARELAEAARAREEVLQAGLRAGEAQARAQVELARGSTQGEARWSEVRGARAAARVARARESRALEAALAIDPRDPRVRSAMADLLYEEVLAEEAEHRADHRASVLERLGAYDDGSRRARLEAEARLEIALQPAGARVELAVIEARAGGRRITPDPQIIGHTPLSHPLPPGGYALRFSAEGHVSAVLPVLLARGETLSLRFALPERAPEGFVFVPPGRFLFGSPEEPSCRTALLSTQPLRPAYTEAFFIARHEATFGDWLPFLEALPERERRRRTPRLVRERGALLLERRGGRWLLSLTPVEHTLRAPAGEPLVYPGRSRRARVDWLRLPVLGVSPEDAMAYAAWLDESGRVPGARLCREDEWERAARGADDRRYPHGDLLLPDEANHDVTYGRDPLGFGPDEVGAHPDSVSPFGLMDMAGNAWEWTRSILAGEELVARGGGWYEDASGALSANRVHAERTMRDQVIGFRLCADVGPPQSPSSASSGGRPTSSRFIQR